MNVVLDQVTGKRRRIVLPEERISRLVVALPEGSRRLGRTLLELGEVEQFIDLRSRVVDVPPQRMGMMASWAKTGPSDRCGTTLS